MVDIIKEESKVADKSVMDFKHEGLETSLDHFIEVLEKKGSSVYVLEGMFSVLKGYFGWMKSDYEIFHKISLIEEHVLNSVLKGKRDTFVNAMAIGQFIEILIKNGLPREISIIATSELLNIGVSTSRTHNENYRKIYLNQHLKGLCIRQYLEVMYDKIVEENSYHYDHPKFKKAFKDTKDFYILRRSEREKVFGKE